MEKKKILFYYLDAFSHTGGIQKFNRCFIKALNESGDYFDSSIVSVLDNESDTSYSSLSSFKGFAGKRGHSLFHIIANCRKYDTLVLGHINLAIAGLLVKLINPGCQIVLIAHGIEVWGRLRLFKKWCLRQADIIFAVSNYTKNQLVLRNNISHEKIWLFPNTIDPYFEVPEQFSKPGYLLERYGLSNSQPVILTLTRISSSEQYKGYDKVFSALPEILKDHPDAIYLLAGRADKIEKERLERLIEENNIRENVILAGFISEKELTDHYRLADVFILPSRKEGFGIVFLEALACGTAVIGGNQDGTVDALHNGSLGKLINPTKENEISSSIIEQLDGRAENAAHVQQKVLSQYQFGNYKQRLQKYLN